ncbi:MAG: hypothetical protein HQ564_08555 [Candidatus Saganbacteria bacterium]|nr:hypothetical protein [Candidatus Saganbacteria bacterium]
MTPELNKRKNRILKAIIDDYIDSAIPVGSRTIYKEYIHDFSPATIRNEMADLEEEGYIAQPHTSAGRIPTDCGYRHFVDNIMKKKTLSIKEKELLRKVAYEMKQDHDEAQESISRVFSDLLDYLTVVVSRKNDKPTVTYSGMSHMINQPEFKNLEKTRKIIELIEHKDSLTHLLDDYANEEEEINVKIGSENKDKEFRDYSVIVTTLGDIEIGIIGPTRMSYSKITALFDFLNQEF